MPVGNVPPGKYSSKEDDPNGLIEGQINCRQKSLAAAILKRMDVLQGLFDYNKMLAQCKVMKKVLYVLCVYLPWIWRYFVILLPLLCPVHTSAHSFIIQL